MRTLARLVLLVAFLPLAASAAVKAPVMVGNWYGEGQPATPEAFWVAHIAPNGSFDAEFRLCEKGRQGETSIKGKWTLKNGLYEFITRTADGQSVYGVNHYKTQSYDGRKHVYRHVETGFLFSAVRVAQTFQLPDCNPTS